MRKRPLKAISLYDSTENDLWKRAESIAREELDAEGAREGEILGELAAHYLGAEGPLSDRADSTADGEVME